MAKAIREVYGTVLKELGETNPDIVVLDADLSGSTKTALFGNCIEYLRRLQGIVYLVIGGFGISHKHIFSHSA